jgi:hypothetical protein
LPVNCALTGVVAKIVARQDKTNAFFMIRLPIFSAEPISPLYNL